MLFLHWFLPVTKPVTECAFRKIYFLKKQKMCDYSFHTVGGSCETGSDDSRVHIADYHPSAETEVGPVAVTSCTSVCPQCRQEAHVHGRMHALGLETTYRVVAVFCTTFLRWRRHWDTFWPNLVREILICCPRIWSLPTTAKKDINCVSVKLSVHMKLNVIFLAQRLPQLDWLNEPRKKKKEYLNKNPRTSSPLTCCLGLDN